jgi:predicted amidophosphoribosyltransferase
MLECAGRHRSQRGLGTAERRANVRTAFRARGGMPASAVVTLVDDVYTTGATVDAAARALRSGGAAAVHVVTLARVVRV